MRSRANSLFAALAAVVCTGLIGCGGGGGAPINTQTIQGNGAPGPVTGPSPTQEEMLGTVRFIPVEAGFYGIEGDDGTKYDPRNLPADLKKDGQRIRFRFTPFSGASAHAWGKLIDLTTVSAEAS